MSDDCKLAIALMKKFGSLEKRFCELEDKSRRQNVTIGKLRTILQIVNKKVQTLEKFKPKFRKEKEKELKGKCKLRNSNLNETLQNAGSSKILFDEPARPDLIEISSSSDDDDNMEESATINQEEQEESSQIEENLEISSHIKYQRVWIQAQNVENLEESPQINENLGPNLVQLAVNSEDKNRNLDYSIGDIENSVPDLDENLQNDPNSNGKLDDKNVIIDGKSNIPVAQLGERCSSINVDISNPQENDDTTATLELERKKSPKVVPNKIPIRKRTFTCENCPKSYTQIHNLKLHCMIHHKEEREKDNSNSTKVKNHKVSRKKLVRPLKLFVCNLCYKSFFQKINLTYHIRTHTGEKPYNCPICPKSFAQVTQLNNHHRIHTGEKPYSCRKCPRKFPQKTNLNDHMWAYH